MGQVKEVKEAGGEGEEEGEAAEEPELQPEVQALGQRARELLEEALAAGDAAATAAARVTGGDGGGSAAGGAGGGLVVDEEEQKDAISAAAKARALLARMLIGGEFVKRDVLLGRRLLVQACFSAFTTASAMRNTDILLAHTYLVPTSCPHISSCDTSSSRVVTLVTYLSVTLVPPHTYP